MSGNWNDDERSPDRVDLDQIIADFVRLEENNGAPDREKLFREHPELAVDLREFFKHRDRIERIIRPLRDAALHVRCPHCQNSIEIVGESSLADISCPSCGSQFSLVDETEGHNAREIGRRIGQFELLEHVGIGQFGSVFKARDTKLDRIVAIKIPRQGRLSEAETELFLRDVRAAAQLKHPHIVGVYEIGREDGTLYIVSDFIQGANLKEWLAVRKLTPKSAAQLCRQVAVALHHAHEAGVIHRDLKPGNIMIDRQAEPHLVDFGLAKREAGEITMTVDGQVIGTPAYMSPEQADGRGHNADRTTDIYALGVILFELLTGELPFRGEKRMLIKQILEDDPPSPRRLNSAAPRDLETICLKCLEKEPWRRYRTAADLADEFTRYLQGEPIRARRSGPVERSWKWVRRQPSVAALYLVSILALCAVVGVVMNRRYSDQLEAANAGLAASFEREERLRQEAVAAADREKNLKNVAESARSKSDEYAYFLSITYARRAWEDSDVGQMERLLDLCPEKYRSWEWSYLKKLPHADLLTLKAEGQLLSLSVTPGAKRIMFVSVNKGLQIYDRVNNVFDDALAKRIGEALGGSRIHCAEFTPDGEAIVAGVEGHTLVRLQLPDCELLNSYDYGKTMRRLSADLADADKPLTSELVELRFAADGTCIGAVIRIAPGEYTVSGNNTELARLGFLRRYGIRTRRLFGPMTPLKLRRPVMDLNKNGRRVMLGQAGRQSFFRSRNERYSLSFCDLYEPAKTYSVKSETPIESVKFATTSDQVCVGYGDGRLGIWKWGAQAAQRTLDAHVGSTTGLAISGGGKIVSCGADRTVHEWDINATADQARVRKIRGHHQRIRLIKVDPISSLIVTGDDNTIKLWDTRSNQQPLLIGSGRRRPLHDIDFVGSSELLVNSNGLLYLVDIAKAAEVRRMRGRGLSLDVNRKKDLLVVGGRSPTATVLTAATGETVHSIKIDQRLYSSRVSFSPDGEHFAISDKAGVGVYNVRSGKLVEHYAEAEKDSITDVVFSPDGGRLAFAVGYRNSIGRVVVIDRQNKSRKELIGADQGILDIEFDKNGRLLAAACLTNTGRVPGAALVWDSQTGELIHRLQGHRYGVWSVAFTPDGNRLATGAGVWKPGPDQGGEIRIWELKFGQELLLLEGHTGAVLAMDFSDDGQLLASASADFTYAIWNVPTGSPAEVAAYSNAPAKSSSN